MPGFRTQWRQGLKSKTIPRGSSTSPSPHSNSHYPFPTLLSNGLLYVLSILYFRSVSYAGSRDHKDPCNLQPTTIRVSTAPPTLSPSFAKKIVLDTSIIGCKTAGTTGPRDHASSLQHPPSLACPFPGVLLAKSMGTEAKRVMGSGIGVA
jgi:hypothetical protein